MTNPLSPRAASEVGRLMQMCTEVLDREERHLTATQAALRQFQHMLTANEPCGLTLALEGIRDAACVQTTIREQRDQFRQAVGILLGIQPALVSLRLVAEHLPASSAAELMSRRVRLRELVGEVDRANQSVALVVWWLLDFVQQVFARIQGQPIGARYNPLGKVQTGPGGPLWQVQG